MKAKTHHKTLYSSAADLSALDDNSVHLVITSPPYPMIEMWDESFFKSNPMIQAEKEAGDQNRAFELMHLELDKVWEQLPRVTCDGGIVCINIGDATRSLDSNFQLFSSHSRIIGKFISLGFQNLPNIIWRKTTNAPNKFMGSGMLPPGAYVTLEHEYILIFRKGPKREFRSPEMKQRRRESAFFWEERNQWFSDVWFDLKGVAQELNNHDLRKRSAAFPFELAYRLVNMFSIKGDCVLDPFLGTGTTTMAAVASERNSVGFEIDSSFEGMMNSQLLSFVAVANHHIRKRVDEHLDFVKQRQADGKDFKFTVESLGLPCISRQETDIVFRKLDSIVKSDQGDFEASYCDYDTQSSCREEGKSVNRKPTRSKKVKAQTSLELN